MLWIGIDVGGTFTDAVGYDEVMGTFAFAKAPSTPADPTRGVLDVLRAMKLDIGSVERLVHGVTIGTNAVLEGKGAEVWMLVTKGFRDVLEIGRTNRPVLYDIRTQKAPPLVPRTRAIEVDERLAYDGTTLRDIDAAEIERLAARIPTGATLPSQSASFTAMQIRLTSSPPRRPSARCVRTSSCARHTRFCHSFASTSASIRRRSTPTSGR